MDIVKINVEYIKTVNYALYHNRIPVCQVVEITNLSGRPIEEVNVTCTGEYISQIQNENIKLSNLSETIRISPYNIVPDR